MSSTPSNDGQIPRREFLTRSAAVAAAASVVPGYVVRADGQTPPSEKLNIAGVGVGGKGFGDLKKVAATESIVALCDVDTRKRDRAAKTWPSAKLYTDYREMLEEEKDLDGIIVATPDHMHAPISLAAMHRGLHVYCQKPLTHTVWEAREMARLAAKKVATQMGNQGQAEAEVRRITEWLADGCIGEVREIHVWTDRPVWPQGVDRPQETPPVPVGLNWERFCGVAPLRPYHPIYHPFKWRGWLDFGTGALGDIGCHAFAPIFRALSLGHPTDVEACRSVYMAENWKPFENKETYPRAAIVRYAFPASGNRGPVRMAWYDGGLKPARPPELEDSRDLTKGGTMYVGTKGVLLNGRLLPESRMKSYTRPPETLSRSIGHYEEWLAACRGERSAGSEFGFAGLVTQAVLLGNVALLSGKRLKWDGEKGQITNVPAANALLKRQYREGWGV